MNIDNNIEIMISNLDLALYSKMKGETNHSDKKSLLAIQNAIRRTKEAYVYLEIGSLLGATIQPHLLDPKCEKIYSIDKRVLKAPDERGRDVYYRSISTEQMLNCLRQVSEDLSKIMCFEDDASNIDTIQIVPKPDICFIDGEHTDKAVISDFRLCKSVLNNEGVVVFHDSHLLCNGLSKIIKVLKSDKQEFRAYNLPAYIFVIEIGSCSIHKDNKINEMLINNYIGYLRGLASMLPYREFAIKKGFPLIKS
jgi:hypothetical protein